jgi:heme/copper-type cytochrome/quinol oxidase subunit 2
MVSVSSACLSLAVNTTRAMQSAATDVELAFVIAMTASVIAEFVAVPAAHVVAYVMRRDEPLSDEETAGENAEFDPVR